MTPPSGREGVDQRGRWSRRCPMLPLWCVRRGGCGEPAHRARGLGLALMASHLPTPPLRYPWLPDHPTAPTPIPARLPTPHARGGDGGGGGGEVARAHLIRRRRPPCQLRCRLARATADATAGLPAQRRLMKWLREGEHRRVYARARTGVHQRGQTDASGAIAHEGQPHTQPANGTDSIRGNSAGTHVCWLGHHHAAAPRGASPAANWRTPGRPAARRTGIGACCATHRTPDRLG